MTIEALKTLLDGTGLQVSYSSVPLDKATRRPYICYSEDNRNQFAADGIVYWSRKVMSIRLYTDTRDEVNEAKVETALSGEFWTKVIDFLDDQKIYQISYEIEV